MVWKKMIAALSLVICFALANSSPILAETVYEKGNISSTYKDIFKDILHNVSINDDYVFFRSGEYEYSLYYGEISLANNTFSSASCTSVIVNTVSSSYNNAIYNYNTSTNVSLNLNAGNYLVYSNLGNYPTLIERGVVYDYAILTAFLVFGVCLFVRPIFKYTYRLR